MAARAKPPKGNQKIARIGGNSFKCFIVGGGYGYVRLMWNMGFQGADCLDKADFVLFTGGDDVSPSLYGEKTLSRTHSNPARDAKEKKIFEACLERNVPMVGICRGGQFLNVMSGGKMYQHVDNHTMPHRITINDPVPNNSRSILVSSTHHQMMIPGNDAVILAQAAESHNRMTFGRTESSPANPFGDDTEVLWYEKTKSLCFQPHPEYETAGQDCLRYFEELVDLYILPNIVKSSATKKGKAA